MILPQEISVIVLAAGQSTRFGKPKLLEDLRGRPLVGHTIDLVSQIPFGYKAAIISPESPRLDALFKSAGFETALNAQPDAGMASSLRIGIAAAGDAQAVLILLADMPFVTPDHLKRLMAAYDPDIGSVGSSRKGVGQPPAIVGRTTFDRIGKLDGDAGAREIIRSGLLVEADSDLLADIDDQQTLDRFNRSRFER